MLGELVNKGPHRIHPTGWRIPAHPTDAEIAGRLPGTADHLEKVVDGLPVTETVHQQAHDDAREVQHTGPQPYQVSTQALQLATDDPQVLGSRGDFHVQELFHGQNVGQVVVHGRDVIHAVSVGNDLLVGLALGRLLDAGVEVPDVWVGANHGLPIQLQHDP